MIPSPIALNPLERLLLVQLKNFQTSLPQVIFGLINKIIYFFPHGSACLYYPLWRQQSITGNPVLIRAFVFNFYSSSNEVVKEFAVRNLWRRQTHCCWSSLGIWNVVGKLWPNWWGMWGAMWHAAPASRIIVTEASIYGPPPVSQAWCQGPRHSHSIPSL